MSSKRKPAAKHATKTETVQAAEAQQVVARVAALKPPDVLRGVTDLQIKVGAALGSLQAMLGEGVRQHEEVQQALAAQQARLKELHEIEDEALSVEAIRAQRAALEQEAAEEEEARALARAREDAEYAYARDLARRKENDQYLIDRAARDADMQRRAQALAEAEQELAALRDAAANAPRLADEAAAKAVREAVGAVVRDHKHESALRDAQAAGEKKLLEQTIQGLIADNKRLQGQYEAAVAQVAVATGHVRAIAEKSVEGAANQTTVASLQDALRSAGLTKPAGR